MNVEFEFELKWVYGYETDRRKVYYNEVVDEFCTLMQSIHWHCWLYTVNRTKRDKNWVNFECEMERWRDRERKRQMYCNWIWYKMYEWTKKKECFVYIHKSMQNPHPCSRIVFKCVVYICVLCSHSNSNCIEECMIHIRWRM